MIKKIQEIEKILEAIKQSMPPVKSNLFKSMTDRELLLELATRCQTFDVKLPEDLHNELKERTKSL